VSPAIVLMVIEAVTVGGAVVVFLALLGLGPTALLLPDPGGHQILLAPAVGLAVLSIAFQWLTPLMPSYQVALLAAAAMTPLTAVAGWRRRGSLLEGWRDLAGAAAVAIAFFVSLLQIVFQRGFFTLGGFPSDNVFIYVQAAEYLRDHPMPSPLHPPALDNPGSYYLITTGPSFPNSVGPLDAAASVLSGWPVYTLHEPVSALALALAVCPAWFLVRGGLGGSWLTALVAGVLLATNQLTYWTLGMGFQQESLALPLFVAGAAVGAHALRTESARAAVLAGIVGGALVGLYLPLAALLGFCVLGATIVHLATGPEAHRRRLLPILAAALASGAAAALAAFYVLLAEGGLAIWSGSVGSRVPAGAISRFPAFPYLAGTVPLAHVWELSPQPLGRIQGALFPILFALSSVVVLLIVAGLLRAVLDRRAPEAALLVAGLAFAGYEALVAGYPYGFVKAVDYLLPLTAVFAAHGAIGLRSLVRSASSSLTAARVAEVAGMGALAAVLLASGVASRDMVKLWLSFDPSFTRADLSLSSLAASVPTGSSVLVDRPTDSYGGLVQVAAIAYFLPDRRLRIFVGDVRPGTFEDQAVHPAACQFDYVIRAQPPDGDFLLSGPVPNSDLNLYRRLGPACA
jgi:hypothetical protein